MTEHTRMRMRMQQTDMRRLLGWLSCCLAVLVSVRLFLFSSGCNQRNHTTRQRLGVIRINGRGVGGRGRA